MLTTLHASVCTPVDRSSAPSLRNHNEELRCIEAVGLLAFEPTLSFLLQQLELTAEVVVVVARCEILVHPLASQLRVEWVDEDRWLCAAAHHHRLELSHLNSKG